MDVQKVNSWAGHYRKNKDGLWNVYISGKIVAEVKDPYQDAKIRFPGKQARQNGLVMVDVR